MGPRRLPSLTSLRFLAASFVFASHLPYLEHAPSAVTRWLSVNVFDEGFIGVTFFFVLSGFILTYTYADQQISDTSFRLKRFARIYPLHVAAFLLSVPLTLSLAKSALLKYGVVAGLNLTLLQSFFPSSGIYFSFNAPSWSISDEMFFYALFPLALPIVLRLATRPRRAWALALAAWSASFLVAAIATHVGAHGYWFVYILPATRLPEFVFGMALGAIFLRMSRKSNPRSRSLVWGSVILFGVLFSLHRIVPHILTYSALYLPAMGAIIFSMGLAALNGWKGLSRRWLVILGEASYSFYLLHQVLIRYLMKWRLVALAYAGHPAIVGLGIFLTASVLSVTFYYAFERPVRKGILSLAGRRFLPTASTAS